MKTSLAGKTNFRKSYKLKNGNFDFSLMSERKRAASVSRSPLISYPADYGPGGIVYIHCLAKRA